MSHDDHKSMKIFAATGGTLLAEQMCKHLELPLAAATIECFPDNEIIVKVNEDVRGRDCFIVQSTSMPVNDNLMELLIWIDTLRRASARRITAVIPYFGYARQDRKDEGRVPITAKLVANLITAAGATRVLCMDLHAAQIQGFFDIPVDHLTATKVFCDYFSQRDDMQGDDMVIVSPDVGNVKVANMYAGLLDSKLAIIDKRRDSGSEVVSKRLIGDVEGKTVLMVDDMISTAGTICEAAKLVTEKGAKKVIAAATHGVIVGPAVERIKKSPISEIIITDTIAPDSRLDNLEDQLQILSVARFLGEAVHRIHHHMSISSLFNHGEGPKK
ncbi:MAG: ribose-phosphate pyrophosphokinase [Phycisphaerae bacterium]|jgi:ribose-phosphate pyrophosphokinase|nr:ribose-phosphate pyrophosphokinase [Phycisphaerae bacterium]